MNNPDFVLRVLELTQYFSELIDWRVDGADVTFFANCNDLFAWATSDGEAITPQNLALFEATVEDLRAVTYEYYTPELFAARSRGMRPHGAAYYHIPVELWYLFDECGPVRDIDVSNPKKQPTAAEVVAERRRTR